MPTGYTSYIKDHDASFGQFVWIIARAFGALIELRDDSTDEPIPRDLLEGTRPADDRHAKDASDAEARLAVLRRMSKDEAAQKAASAYQESLRNWKKVTREKERDEGRYRAMLAKAKSWKHVGMRAFMVEQIEESIRFDCGSTDDWKPVERSGIQWRADEIKGAERDLAHHREHQAEDDVRQRGRRAWLRALLDSVPYEAPPRRARVEAQ